MPNDYDLRNPGRPEAVVALLVATIVLLIAWVAGRGGGSLEPTDLSSLASSPGDSLVRLDLSDNVPTDRVDDCLTPAFAASVADVTVLYAELQKSEDGNVPVLVLRNAAGDLLLCDSFGAESAPGAPPLDADDDHPVRFLAGVRQSWSCSGSRLAGYALSHWLSVSNEVDRVELRFVVDGAHGPWFGTSAQGGLAHLHAWLGEQNEGASVATQVRVLDSQGDPIQQDALPATPQPVASCAGGGVQTG